MPDEARTYTSKKFDKFATDEGITDAILIEAVNEIESNPRQGNLGGQVIKKRVGREDGGKSGGYRTIVLFGAKNRAIFAYGFPKNSKATLSPKEEKAFKKLAKEMLSLSDEQMQMTVDGGGFREIKRGDNDETV
jgi:hypothetical protein